MTADQIAASARAEAQRLRVSAQRLDALADLLQGKRDDLLADALAAIGEPLTEAELAQEAPYGYKADGTPYKRRPPAEGDGRRLRRTNRAAGAKTRRQRSGTTLRVLSSTHPTEQELADREIVHTTEAPAAADGAA